MGDTGRRHARQRLTGMSIFDATRSSTELDRFGWVLVLVVVAIVGQMLIDVSDSLFGSSISHALSGSVLVVAVRAAGLNRRLVRIVDAVVVAFLLATIALNAYDVATGAHLAGSRAAVVMQVGWLLTTALVPVVVARRLATHRVVTLETIMGAVAAFLQIAVAYAFVFHAVDQWQPGAMFDKRVTTSEYTYFSLVTITTTGYGDLAPTGNLARLFSVSEAVLGQVFLVTFVALIVARFATRRDAKDATL